MTDFRSRERMVDVREERKTGQRCEVRSDSSGTIILEGYAATHDPYDVAGGPASGGWVETLGMTAFDRTLATGPDVQLLINHEGPPLARTKSGTLLLTHDRNGLKVRAMLDPSDPDVQRIMPKMKPQANGRANMDEMSFAFRVKDQTWDTNYTARSINELSLHKGDVSVVNYGMNPGTSAALSADTIGALAMLSSGDLMELRSKLDPGTIDRAILMLDEVRRIEGRAKDPNRPYGDVKYADPGYKDGQKRYPIDNLTHAKAAWSYINMPKNQSGYSSTQVKNIKSRIQSALKEFGVDVSESKSIDVEYIDIARRADGGATLIAVMTDGSRVALPSQKVSAGENIQVSTPTPDNRSAFAGSGLVWNPAQRGDPPKEEPMDDECGPTEEEKGAPMQGCLGGDNCKGPDCPVHGEREYDPVSGDGVVREDPTPAPPAPALADDSGDVLAAALDSTISHAYALADGNPDMRKLLSQARWQLNALRGKPPREDTDVSRRLAEIRKEVNMPETASVADCLTFLRNQGTAPVGYGGLLTSIENPLNSVTDLAARVDSDVGQPYRA